MIIIVIGAIIYIKFKRNKYINHNNNYYNIEGKNIPFDDEDNSGIN